MRRNFPLFTAALIFCLLALLLSAPVRPGSAQGSTLQEKCDNCIRWVSARYEQCLATHEVEDQQRCHDQFNEGIVICHRNFCEQ